MARSRRRYSRMMNKRRTARRRTARRRTARRRTNTRRKMRGGAEERRKRVQQIIDKLADIGIVFTNPMIPDMSKPVLVKKLIDLSNQLHADIKKSSGDKLNRLSFQFQELQGIILMAQNL